MPRQWLSEFSNSLTAVSSSKSPSIGDTRTNVRNPQREYWSKALVGVGVCVVVAAVVLPFDLTISRLFHSDNLRGDFRKLFSLSQIFSHGIGVALIALTMFVLDQVRRPQMPRVFACVAMGGWLGHVAKVLLVRERPGVFGEDVRGEGFVKFAGPVWESFSSYAALAAQGIDTFDGRYHSMPSGHAATAVALAIGLSYLYPRGRWLFCSIALLASLQRVVTSAHYLSDVLIGAGVGIVGATLCIERRGLGRWFDPLERRLSGTRSDHEPVAAASPAVTEK